MITPSFIKKFFISHLIGGVIISLHATVEVTPKHKTIALDETLSVQISLINQGGDIQLESKDFQVLPSIERSTSIEIINNNVKKSILNTYYLKPLKKGDLSFKVLLDKKVIGTHTIKVVPKGTAPPRKKTPQRNNLLNQDPFGFQSSNHKVLQKDDVLIKNIPSKTTVYVDEPFIVDTVIFYKVGIESPRLIKPEPYVGFSATLIENSLLPSGSTNINGVSYKTQVLTRQLVYAHYPGKHQIKGSLYQIDHSHFFFSRGSRMKVEASDMEIKVMDLPTKNKPIDFQNAIGDFSIKVSSLPPKAVQVHTPITLQITVSGKGNLRTLLMPELHLNYPSVIVKNSKVKDNFQIQNNTYIGEKSIEYYLIPEQPMTLRLPTITFTTFSLIKKKYLTSKVPLGTVKIVGNPNASIKPSSTGKTSSPHQLFPIHNTSLKHQSPLFPFSSLVIVTHTAAFLLTTLILTGSFLHRRKKSNFKRPIIETFKQQTKNLASMNQSDSLNRLQKALFKVIHACYPQCKELASTYQIEKALQHHKAPKEAFMLLSKINQYQSITFSPEVKSLEKDKEVDTCLRLIKTLTSYASSS